MAFNGIGDDATLLTTKMMSLAMERQRVIANNMANASTPGYIRKELDFQGSLSDAIKSGDISSNLSSVKASVVDDQTDVPKLDGNNINVAKEMSQMMQNSVFFNLLSRAYSTRMNIIRSSMKGSF